MAVGQNVLRNLPVVVFVKKGNFVTFVDKARLAVERYVDSLPGLSDRKRAFLKQYPLLLQEENSKILRAEYNRASSGHCRRFR